MQIMWFSEIKWDYLRTRKQQIISRKPADVQILYLEPYVRGRRNLFRLRTEGDVFCATIPFIKSAPTFLWRTVLDRRSARRAVDFVARARIKSIVKDLRFDLPEVGLVISNIYAADIALSLPRKFLLYDCNDDHASFPGMRAWTETYFSKTSRNADAVFASSQALLTRVASIRGNRDDCSYLGNGVDFSHFETANDRGVHDKPRFGYIGALAPWLDFAAVDALARRHPEWEVVLVGPILQGVEDQVLKLTSLPNVFHLAAVSYDRLPDILKQFSVGLIPFRCNQLTRGVNPNKLYEYLAAGLPVVSTRFSEEVQNYPDLVKAVDAGEDFVAACEQTIVGLSDGATAQDMREKARQTAKKNDWNLIAEIFWKRVSHMMS
ncbi:MAG: glycosyltransferase [Candidatus Krumholzibacteria bacterium]|nr:glycosyltransferase [Candidatus Krumholzibacteria bacterium]